MQADKIWSWSKFTWCGAGFAAMVLGASPAHGADRWWVILCGLSLLVVGFGSAVLEYGERYQETEVLWVEVRKLLAVVSCLFLLCGLVRSIEVGGFSPWEVFMAMALAAFVWAVRCDPIDYFGRAAALAAWQTSLFVVLAVCLMTNGLALLVGYLVLTAIMITGLVMMLRLRAGA